MQLHLYEESVGAPDTADGPRKRAVASLTLVVDAISVDEVIARHVTHVWNTAPTGPELTRAAAVASIETGLDRGTVTLETAIAQAQDAFRDGRFLFFWNDEQITEPERLLNTLDENEAVFLRLLPMKGG